MVLKPLRTRHLSEPPPWQSSMPCHASQIERTRENDSRVYILRETRTAGEELLQRVQFPESTFQQLNHAETESRFLLDVSYEVTVFIGICIIPCWV